MGKEADNRTLVEAGAVFSVRYPFIREVYETLDEDRRIVVKAWRPGVRFEYEASHQPEIGPEAQSVADAEGAMVLAVVSIHRPGHYPIRVFYTRGWLPPSGPSFGKAGLKVATLDVFRRRTAGYLHPYRLAAPTAEGGEHGH